MTVIKQDPNLVPLCPHCEEPLNEVKAREAPVTGKVEGSVGFRWGKRSIYACPRCNKALGISHRKGFWAG